MIVDGFLTWARTAASDRRAEGASALARAFLYADLDEAQRRTAELTLTALLDDPAAIVRQAIAEAMASAADAPHHIVTALANDHSSVSAPILKRSPQLTDSELVDCAAMGDALAQAAIATRPELSAPVAAALSEIAAREAVIVLCVNAGADLPEFSMHRILERFGDDGEVREALLQRPDLPASVRLDLISATAGALSRFVSRCGWLSEERAGRVTREEREKATIVLSAIACRGSGHGPSRFVAHLRSTGQLTAGLVLRALLSGHRALFEAALSELSGQSAERVAGLVERWAGSGFEALYRRAGLPQSLLPAFRAALAAQEEFGFTDDEMQDLRLQRMMVDRVLTACEDMPAADAGKLTALLRRFEAEAAREEAREHARRMEIEDAICLPRPLAEDAVAIDLSPVETGSAPAIVLTQEFPEMPMPDPEIVADERFHAAAVQIGRGSLTRALRMAFRRAA